MPLQKTLVPVDIVAGLDTKNDPKLTPALTDLKNGRYTVGSRSQSVWATLHSPKIFLEPQIYFHPVTV